MRSKEEKAVSKEYLDFVTHLLTAPVMRKYSFLFEPEKARKEQKRIDTKTDRLFNLLSNEEKKLFTEEKWD